MFNLIAVFEGELLSSLLQMILSSPFEFVESELLSIRPILCSALDLGLSGVSSASTWALDALEIWFPRLEDALLDDFFRESELLSKLGAFLNFEERKAVAKPGQAVSGALKQRYKNRLDQALRVRYLELRYVQTE